MCAEGKVESDLKELSDLFGMDCVGSDDSVDDLGASEQFLDELDIPQQKWSLGGDGTEVGNDGIDDDDDSVVLVSWIPDDVWHQGEKQAVSGEFAERFVQEKTTQSNNQVGKEEEDEDEDCQVGKSTEFDDGTSNL